MRDAVELSEAIVAVNEAICAARPVVTVTVTGEQNPDAGATAMTILRSQHASQPSNQPAAA